MARLGKSFWGDPTCQPREADVARFLEVIRETTRNYGPKRALQIATSAMEAITAFVVHSHGPREALALLDKLRHGIVES
jgi:hypothetical protein